MKKALLSLVALAALSLASCSNSDTPALRELNGITDPELRILTYRSNMHARIAEHKYRTDSTIAANLNR